MGMKKKGAILKGMLALLICAVPTIQARAETIYDSPYVTFSPDGQAFTTNDGDRDVEWYEKGTAIENDIPSNLRELNEGEHYYQKKRHDTVPISRWEVVYQGHTCIHNNYYEGWHDLDFTMNGGCGKPNFSGWTAICADCGENCTDGFIYMSMEAARSLQFLDMSKDYYYLCPFDKNLEQGYHMQHKCEDISWNKYLIRYRKNGAIGGYMAPTTHMYNNQTVYEGETITPDTKLRKNDYTRLGYEFIGWNTEADGTGEWFSDGQEIYNLTAENYNPKTVELTGEIYLYAQWRRTTNTLEIDPAGGSYNDSTSVTTVTQDYGTTYSPKTSWIKPPRGATITFDTQGGSPVSPITGTQSFKEWSMGTGFSGKFTGDTYTYLGPDGHTDRLTAVYTRNSITLPGPVKNNASFAGWYTDPEGGSLAGYAGDRITPTEDTTLYARWVSLLLTAINDYTSNQKKGAVDLVWIQPDLRMKTFILKQRREGEDWVRLLSASEAGDSPSVSESFGFTGKEGTYRVPYTGFYTLTAYGAQGGNYGAFAGGLGGEATGRFWLEAGERLTYNTGGQNGYNGGGAGNMFSNGGGCTTVTSDRKGLLLTAGGGGSATGQGSGEAGGSTTSNVPDSGTGGSGGAGGGGGYRGGNAGEHIVHNHAETCYHTDSLDYTVMQNTGGDWGYGEKIQNFHNTGTLIVNRANEEWQHEWEHWSWGNSMESRSAFHVTEKLTDNSFMGICLGGSYNRQPPQDWTVQWNYSNSFAPTIARSPGDLIPVNGNTHVEIHAWMDGFFYDGRVIIRDQDGNRISFTRHQDGKAEEGMDELTIRDVDRAANPVYTGTRSVMSGRRGVDVFCINESVALPEGTTAISIEFFFFGNGRDVWGGINIGQIRLTGGERRYLSCAYADRPDGFVVSSRPAYGGSSYINTDVAVSYTEKAGVRTGNGGVAVTGSGLGYQMASRLDDAAAPDLAAPDTPVISSSLKAVGTDSVQVEWSRPQDRGTRYYHQVTSYVIDGGTVRQDLTSNITENVLATGIKGYHTLLADTGGHSPSTGWAYQDVSVPWTTVALKNTPQYLHVAAVDVAGNLSAAAVIRIEAAEEQDTDWSVATGPVTVRQDENVWHDTASGVYYIRADGVTPFSMGFRGMLRGTATKNYQIDTMEFGITGQETESFSIQVPRAAAVTPDTVTYTSGFERTVTEPEYFSDAAYTMAVRSNRLKDVEIVQKFTAAPEYSGERFRVIPGAMAGTTRSAREQDLLNGLDVVPDGVAPEISGLGQLETLDRIDREHENILLVLQASDSLSGLRDMTVYIQNTDNYSEQTWTADSDGRVEISITQDSYLFTGDFSIIITATDNVGNVCEETYRAMEFFLTGEIVRILEPHDPVFRCGESGILTVRAGGYVDSVEVKFPVEVNKELDYNMVYTYDIRDYIQEESIQFMVPLYTPEKEYSVTVTAFKENGEVKSIEIPFTVEGTVQDDFRTRLR